MDIKLITASNGIVYGLGKNNKIYWWNRTVEKWELLTGLEKDYPVRF